MSNFGALTDHFGLESASLVLVNSEETPVAQNRVDAQDENNDIVASAYHGNTTQDMREISCTYALKSSTLNINTIKLGQVDVEGTKIIRESVEATTSNDAWPQITVSGRKNVIDVTAPTGKTNTFSLPSVTLTGSKYAQALLFTVGSGGRLTGSSISASIEIAQQDDGEGEPIAHGISGGSGEISADFVRVTTAPTWTVSTGAPNADFGITVTQQPGASEGQASFHTASATAAFTIIRDNA